MRIILVLVAVLFSAVALAQSQGAADIGIGGCHGRDCLWFEGLVLVEPVYRHAAIALVGYLLQRSCSETLTSNANR